MQGMMLMAIIAGMTGQNILKKKFNHTMPTRQDTALPFNLLTAISACFILAALGWRELEWHTGTIGYAVVFGLCFAMTTMCSLKAIQTGSLALTSLLIACSLVLPVLIGIAFLGERVTWPIGIGFGLFFAALGCIHWPFGTARQMHKKGWPLYVTMAMVGNGLCATVQKVHQQIYPGLYRVSFLLLGMLVVVILLGVTALQKPRQALKDTVQKGWLLAIGNGAMNAMVNLLVLTLTAVMPALLLFPVVSAGSIVCTLLVASFIYRERLLPRQWLGFCLGLGAIWLMNL